MKKIFDEIEKHMFITEVMNDYSKTVNVNITTLDKTYIDSVKYGLFRLFDGLNQIYICYNYLSNLETQKLENDKIKKYDYIDYHLQNLYIKMVIIYDLVLLIISEVEKLGFTRNNCNYRQIIENKNTNIDTINHLRKFHNYFINIKEIRNLIVHLGYYENTDLLILKSVTTFINRKDLMEIKEDELLNYKNIKKIKTTDIIIKSQNDIKEYMGNINKLVYQLFNVLKITYENNKAT